MKVVIACAKSKVCNAGYMKTTDGRCVKFVGNPAVAPSNSEFSYAHPDKAKGGKTWREKLVAYNKAYKDEKNPFKLLQAYKLYKHKIYAQLVEVFGIDNVYILSAGWGLIRASFLTPNYDITFSAPDGAYNLRRKCDQYSDFKHLQEDSHLMNLSDDTVVFFGTDSSKNGVKNGYLPLFCDLTKAYPGHRIAYYYHSKDKLKDKNVEFVPYETRRRTLWHYECAKKVIECYKSDPCGFDPWKIKG